MEHLIYSACRNNEGGGFGFVAGGGSRVLERSLREGFFICELQVLGWVAGGIGVGLTGGSATPTHTRYYHDT